MVCFTTRVLTSWLALCFPFEKVCLQVSQSLVNCTMSRFPLGFYRLLYHGPPNPPSSFERMFKCLWSAGERAGCWRLSADGCLGNKTDNSGRHNRKGEKIWARGSRWGWMCLTGFLKEVTWKGKPDRRVGVSPKFFFFVFSGYWQCWWGLWLRPHSFLCHLLQWSVCRTFLLLLIGVDVVPFTLVTCEYLGAIWPRRAGFSRSPQPEYWGAPWVTPYAVGPLSPLLESNG